MRMRHTAVSTAGLARHCAGLVVGLSSERTCQGRKPRCLAHPRQLQTRLRVCLESTLKSEHFVQTKQCFFLFSFLFF
ncbi:hypothetical protein CI102_10507 [Trichoderma harzianum]|nr:hypothetical protein CI102_10507 [Trichoderma harzianum]